MKKAHYKAICSLNCLPGIRAFVREELKKLDLTPTMVDQLVLAVDEACANSIIHQHKNDGVSNFDLFLFEKDKMLTIEIRDSGKPFPIDQYKPEELDSIISRRIQGGLGIFLITKIMDKIEVDQKKDGFTYRFIKYLDK